MKDWHTSRRVSSGFGVKFSRPLTKSMYRGGSCSTRGRTCFIMGGLRFSNCFIVISAWIHITRKNQSSIGKMSASTEAKEKNGPVQTYD